MRKVVLITGSTSGIGRAMSFRFAKEGFDIAINGFGQEEEIAFQLKEIESFGVKASYFESNLTEKSQCKDLVEKANRYFGQLDILINNAGLQHVAPLEAFPDEKWDSIIALNLSASFHTTKAVLPIMRAQNWGRIINIASTHGLIASVHKAAYVASKHGLVGLTKVTALETAKENITCNAICPGFIYTPLVEAQIQAKAKEHNLSLEEEKVRFISEKHPSQKFVEMEDVANLAFFLSTESAKEIRGSSYVIDGGWSAV